MWLILDLKLVFLTLLNLVVTFTLNDVSHHHHNQINYCCVCDPKSGLLKSINCTTNLDLTSHQLNLTVIGGGGGDESCEEAFLKSFNLTDLHQKDGHKFFDFLFVENEPKIDCRQVNGEWLNGDKVDYIKLGLTLYSLALLSFTVGVYLFLPSLRNVHGKAVICHLGSMGIVFGLQILQQFHVQLMGSNLEAGKRFPSPCWILGFTLYFFNLAANAWLSVINFDIWTTFKKSCRRFNSDQLSKRFSIYSLMGWGVPGILSAILVTLDLSLPSLSYWKPGISTSHCFLPVMDSWSMAIYFYTPIGSLLVFNVVIFIWTNFSLCSAQSETSRIIKTDKKYQQLAARCFLFCKLTCVMGATFSINLGLWLSGYDLHKEKSWAGRLVELANVSHGFCYFIVFVCKGSVLKLVKRKFFQNGSTTTRSAIGTSTLRTLTVHTHSQRGSAFGSSVRETTRVEQN